MSLTLLIINFVSVILALFTVRRDRRHLSYFIVIQHVAVITVIITIKQLLLIFLLLFHIVRILMLLVLTISWTPVATSITTVIR